jgi:YfiH family protein
MEKSIFTLRKTDEITFYSCRAFEELEGLYHGFSTRHGRNQVRSEHSFNLGYTAWDSPQRVDENRSRFLSALNPHRTSLATLRQIHSGRVHIIKEFPGQWNPPEGDAFITRSRDIALAVQTADCLPVLIADPDHDAVAAVHSGWRGTLERIAFRTIREMQNAFGSNPAHLLVAVGPGIRSCCFEVGPEVSDLFNKKYPGAGLAIASPDRPGKFFLDLPGTLKLQFHAAGIHPENVYDIGLCTCCNTDTFFSYRAEGGHAGRMMAVIGRTSISKIS